MGSWNGTCGVTQLPIKYRDSVVVFPIKYNYGETKGGGFCHITDMYLPLTPPIHGVYNDYGRIEGIDQEKSQSVMDMLLYQDEENVIQLPKDTYETLEDIVYVIERGKVKDVGLMMVHKGVYEEIIDEMGSRKMHYHVDTTLKKAYQESIGRFKECALADIATGEHLFAKTIDELDETYVRYHRRVMGYRIPCIDEIFYAYPESIEKSVSEKYLIQRVMSEDKGLETALVEFKLFAYGMSLMRKFWTIQTGAGSQIDEVYLQKRVADYVIRKEQEICKGYIEDEGYT